MAASKRSLVTLGIVATMGASLGLTGTAGAAPVYPSQQQVEDARAAAGAKAAQVRALENSLAAANDRLEEAQVAAEIAVEDYNEAMVRLGEATAVAEQSRRAADAAQAELDRAGEQIGTLAAQAYRRGGTLGEGIEAVLAPDGPQDLIDRADAMSLLGTRNQRVFADADQARHTSMLAQQQAATAEQARQRAADEAEAARIAAQARQDEAAALVASTARQRESTIAQLAVLNNTTAVLEQQRQAGLEAERREAAERAAREEAARREAARAAAEAAARAAAERAAAQAAAAQAAREQSSAGSSGSGGSSSSTGSSGGSSGATGSSGSSGSSGSGSSQGSASAGQAAVEWARTQIGKPYVWGATGPNSYDCSGLTGAAWRHAGVNLPRTSRDQYRATKKVPYSQLRPGDLIFYGNGNDASSVHHVTIYAGNGRMIEAPRTGLDVRETALRMSGAMDYAGRP